MPDALPPIGEIIQARSGEALELNDRYLNRQLGRIVRTLGFDRDWGHGEGAHLIDAEGERYLDLLCGYGVFAVGRNHPEVVAALRATLEAQTASLPQLGVTALPGVLAEQLVQRSPARIEAMVTANSGTESVEAAIKLARATTGRPRILFAEHAFHGLTLGSLSLNGNEEFRDGFGPSCPTARRSRSATSTRCAASSNAATSPPSSSSRSRARASTCRRRATWRARRRPAAARHAVRLRRGADRHRAHRPVLRARALGP